MPDGSTLTPARARYAQLGRARVHVVPVLHSDKAPTRPALCGMRPTGAWTLHPTWPDEKCALCAERQAAHEGHPVPVLSLRDAALAVREAYAQDGLLMLSQALRTALGALAAADPTDPGTYPARRRDPATSQRGAASAKIRAGSQRARLLYAYSIATNSRGHGFTADEAQAWARLPATACYWKRCSELREAGLIEPTGELRDGRAAEGQMVCRITDTGRRVLTALKAEQ